MSKTDGLRQKRRILITGGMGFVGTAMTKRFSRTDDVSVVDRLDFGMSPEVESLIQDGCVEWIETDLAQVSELHQRVANGDFDVIIHLASLTHIPLCEAYPDVAYQSNVISALNLISRLPTECKFVNFSTSSTYAPELKPHVETSLDLVPCDFYGWTKKHVEDLAQYYAERNGLRILNIRPANAVGFGETNPKLLGTIFEQLKSGKLYIELGNLTPRRDFIHIDDIAWVIDRLVQLWPIQRGHVETFNVGTGYPPVSVGEIAEKIVKLSGRPIEIRSVAERRRQVERELLVVDVKKLKSVIDDYRPKQIDDWLPELVKDPGIRVTNCIETRLKERALGT